MLTDKTGSPAYQSGSVWAMAGRPDLTDFEMTRRKYLNHIMKGRARTLRLSMEKQSSGK